MLVHCNGASFVFSAVRRADRAPGGISLSPSFVVMYVMQRLQITWEDALHMVQNRRYCISPNGGFLTQIKVRRGCPSSNRLHGADNEQEYESIYKASLAVRSFPQQGTANVNTRRKRADDSDDEESARCVHSILWVRIATEQHCSVDDRKRQLVDDEDDAMEM